MPDTVTLTEQHRRAAFEAMAWLGWTFEAAMQDPVRSRLVQLRAQQMRQARTKTRRRVVVVPMAGLQPYQRAFLNDLKRAAAGDRDD